MQRIKSIVIADYDVGNHERIQLMHCTRDNSTVVVLWGSGAQAVTFHQPSQQLTECPILIDTSCENHTKYRCAQWPEIFGMVLP